MLPLLSHTALRFDFPARRRSYYQTMANISKLQNLELAWLELAVLHLPPLATHVSPEGVGLAMG